MPEQPTAITITSDRGPSLVYASSDARSATPVDQQAVSDPRERAICRALLVHALALLDAAHQGAAPMTDVGLNARRATALHALSKRPSTRPPRFPGETQPSGNVPDDPDLAARYFNARFHGLPFQEEDH